MTSIWTDTAAWVGLPLVLLITAAGVGLAVERACRVELPGPLIAPLGACGSIVLVMPLAAVGLGSWPCLALLLLVTVAGFVLNRRDWRRHAQRVGGGWAGLAALLVFGLYMAPTALTGHWTWSGYNFVNDTAFQFLLADWVQHHGIPYHAGPRSTTTETVRMYLATRYPIGSQVHLATLSTMLGVRPDVVYASYVSGLVALTAMALAALARRALPSAKWAAAAGFVAASASLTYHYALQGNIKEMAMLLAAATMVAAGRELLVSQHAMRAVLGVAIAAAAALSVYYAAALPYIGAIGGALLLAGLVTPMRARTRRRLPLTLVTAGVTATVLALPAVIVVGDSLTSLRGTFSTAPGAGAALGQLARPLPLYQIGGVWLDGDYRVPVAGRPAELLTTVGLVAVFALAAFGTAACLRRREAGPVVLLAAGLLVYAVVAPRTSPYADAKMLALLSPAVVLCAVVGAAYVLRRVRIVGVAVAAAVGALVLGSAAFAYHDVRLAPMDRMADLNELGERYAGSERLMLFDEYEEFAKYYMREARINVPTEAITEAHIGLRNGGDFLAHTFDLDEMTLPFVERYPAIITRRQPTSSRPPANYEPEYRTAFYEVWRRIAGLQVLQHLPLQGANSALEVPRCGDVRALAARAGPGTTLVAATAPETATFDFARDPRRPRGWNPDLERPGELVLGTPGTATARMTVRGGDYGVWLEGSFGRRMEVKVDGKAVGAAHGVNTPRSWLPAGRLRLAPGTHTVEVRRPPGDLAPGNGARSSLGAVALVADGGPRLLQVAPSDARTLCGRPLDWIEVVRGRLP